MMSHLVTKLAASLGLVMVSAAGAQAQSLAGVFGPDVNPNDRSVQYRIAHVPDEGSEATAQRIHYQRAVNDAHRWRVLVQANDPANDDWELRTAKGEWQWQLRERGEGLYSTALRFDGSVDLTGDRTDKVGVNWTNQWAWANGFQIRALGMSSMEVGDGSTGGVSFQLRESASWKTENGVRYGVDVFHSFGNWRDFGDFDDQNHRGGPFISLPIGPVGLLAGVNFGLSERAPDSEFRIWLSRKLGK